MSHETTAVMSCYLAHESRSNTACHRFNSHVTAVAVVDSVPVVRVTSCGQCLAWAYLLSQKNKAVVESEKKNPRETWFFHPFPQNRKNT